MAITFNSYTGLSAAVAQWRGRPGDALLSANFDNFLANCERRIYFGHAVDQPGNPLRSEPLRVPEMETVNATFALLATTPWPANFLELISALLNSPQGPMQIVPQRTIDGQSVDGLPPPPSQPRLIAISGTNFRVFPDPGTGSYTATLRFYQKLPTPTPSSANAILTNYSDVYLYGCLVESCILEQDDEAAAKYLPLFNASVSGLNEHTNRITASANPTMRLRAGNMP